MKILFYRYGSIVEPDLINCFKKIGLEVVEETSQITNKNTTSANTIESVSKHLQKDVYLFVFSINFFPAVSEICQIYNKPYVCWTVDSPVMELFSPALSNKCNIIFLFDRAQYNYFKHKNPDNIFYLPLATNVNHLQEVVNKATNSDVLRFSSDISFIGSLYTEKNPYSKITGLSDFTKGYIDGLIESQLKIYGYNFIEDMLNEAIMKEFTELVPDLTKGPYSEYSDPKYVIANNFIGMELAVRERQRILELLSENHYVNLYTLSNTVSLPKVNCKGSAKTLTEMPIIFNKSKINLNITIKPIQTGLSLRVFDCIGSGGFLISNYQEELPEFYEIGSEIETYTSLEELNDKVDFYLSHNNIREKIALAGLEKTAKCHTYDIRIAQMIKTIFQTLGL